MEPQHSGDLAVLCFDLRRKVDEPQRVLLGAPQQLVQQDRFMHVPGEIAAKASLEPRAGRDIHTFQHVVGRSLHYAIGGGEPRPRDSLI